MTDATEQIQYLHTLSQISRSCLDELTKENQKLKKEIQQHIKAREESEARQARDDTRSYLHGLKKENERGARPGRGPSRPVHRLALA